MLFNVSGLIHEGIGATRKHQVEGLLHREDGAPELVSGEVELLRTKAGILVRTDLRVEEPETCSRCLKPLQETVRLKFEEEFRTRSDPASAGPSEDVDYDAFYVDEDHQLDLTEAVRQYREASAEMQPLCRPDCKGLCPRCGQDLNLEQCSCNLGPADNRWAALSGLLSEAEGKE